LRASLRVENPSGAPNANINDESAGTRCTAILVNPNVLRSDLDAVPES
jgi:hypothetical protein